MTRWPAEPPILPTNSIPMGMAAVCLDCSSLFDVRRLTCPNCASAEVWTLAAWLERVRQPEAAP